MANHWDIGDADQTGYGPKKALRRIRLSRTACYTNLVFHPLREPLLLQRLGEILVSVLQYLTNLLIWKGTEAQYARSETF